MIKVEKTKKIDPNKIKYLLIDKFCGFGGVTEGAINAKNTIVIAAINHDEHAILSHILNHPETTHFNEDITCMYGHVKYGVLFVSPQMKRLLRKVEIYRALYPNAKLIMHSSSECTNYSIAKGGQPRDADSRSLPEHEDRYIYLLDPDIITIENVKEFMSWGPMRVACKREHKENIKKGVYANSELKWCYNKKKKRSELAFVPISKRNGEDYQRWVRNIQSLGYNYDWRVLNSANYGAYTSRDRLFITFAKEGIPIVWPKATHSKDGKEESDLFGTGLKPWNQVRDCIDFKNLGKSIFSKKKRYADNTLKTILGGLKKFAKQGDTDFLFKYYGNGLNLNSLDDPAGVLTTKDRFAKICCILRNYKTGFTTSIDTSIGTLPTVPKANLLSFIRNPSHFGHTMQIDGPGPVIIARQDKAPLYIVNAIEGKLIPDITNFFDKNDWDYINGKPDSKKSIAIELVEFMIENSISDIKMRMLTVDELLIIQGFPADYKMVGNQTQKKKFIGNSVVPLAYEVILRAFEEEHYHDDTCKIAA